MTNILKVDGVTLPTPTSMDYLVADLQSDGYRDEAGLMHKTTVRWGVRTLKVKWAYTLTNYQLRELKSAISNKEYMTVQFYNESTEESGTMTAYIGNREYSLKREGRWANLSVSFIEQ